RTPIPRETLSLARGSGALDGPVFALACRKRLGAARPGALEIERAHSVQATQHVLHELLGRFAAREPNAPLRHDLIEQALHGARAIQLFQEGDELVRQEKV